MEDHERNRRQNVCRIVSRGDADVRGVMLGRAGGISGSLGLSAVTQVARELNGRVIRDAACPSCKLDGRGDT